MVHNLLVQFFTLDSSKIQIFETYFFDIGITQDDHAEYVKHVSTYIYVFLTFGCRGGGGGHRGGLPRDWYTTCLCSFSPWAAQQSNFSKLICLIP